MENERATNSGKENKKRMPTAVKIILGVLGGLVSILVLLVILSFIFGDEEEPAPDPDETPVIGQITINDVEVSEPVITVGDITLVLTKATEEDEKKLYDSGDDVPVVRGKTNDGSSFAAHGYEMVVTNGKDKVKGTVTSADTDIDPAKAAAVVSASLKPQPYDEKTKDFTTKQSIYFAEIADCNIYYPTQMKLAKKSSDEFCFVDAKSGAELRVKFTKLKGKNENTEGDRAAKLVKGDYIVESFSSVGNGYLAETTLFYPDKYSYVYDVLKKLIRTEFMEQNMYSYSYVEDAEGSNTEMQSIYYPSHDCCITIPIEFEEVRNEDDIIYFRDYIRDHLLTLTFADLADGTNTNNIFEIFDVVAEDDAIWLTEDSVTWHNGSGLFVGAANDGKMALIEIEGADAYDSFSDSVEQWGITFTDNSMFVSYADSIRDDIIIELLKDISDRLAAIEELLASEDYADIEDMSDSGDEDIYKYAYLQNYEIMKLDPNSLLQKLHFSNMNEAHDEWDGEIGKISFYTENGNERDKFFDNINYLQNHGFSVVFEDTDEWDDSILFMINDEDIGIWVRYYDIGGEIVFFNCDEEPVKTREPGKLYLSSRLKSEFLNDIVPDPSAMIDFINDVNNAYNTICNYWVQVDREYEERFYYFYEIDSRSDGGLQVDVYSADNRLSHVETFAFVDYNLYAIEENGELVFIR